MFPSCSISGPMAFRTLRDIDHAGHDVRAWCFECARGETVDGIVWLVFQERGWPDALPDAARRFRCKSCGRSDAVLLVPATRPKSEPVTWHRAVEAWFHGKRKGRKLFSVD